MNNNLPKIPKKGMPVTIITGFLGSGKTTLLNQILQNDQGLKVAVLVNEFGDIDIDSQLLVSQNEEVLQLSNGCICCTINEDLVEAVYKVLSREDKVDYLVIETSGVADPLPIIITFVGSNLRDLVRLDSILTVVDADTFTPEHFDSEAALNQIAYGDIILLNKTDLVDGDHLDALENYINEVKAGARILRTTHCQVPLPVILDIGVFSGENITIDGQDHHHEHHHEHGCGHDCDHDHHDHHHEHTSNHLENDGFISVSFQSDRPFMVEKFQDFLNDLPKNVFRAKGILWFKESQLRHIFQLSGKRYDMSTDEWTKERQNQIVFIGRNLDAQIIRDGLNGCLAKNTLKAIH